MACFLCFYLPCTSCVDGLPSLIFYIHGFSFFFLLNFLKRNAGEGYQWWSRARVNQHPPMHQSWMDGALIGFSFLSLCHPRLTLFSLPFLILISPDLSFFCNFIFSPPPSQFLFPDLCFSSGTLFSPLPRFFSLISVFFQNFIFLPKPHPGFFFFF